ncbi:hypothetical protein L1987_66826 [Smallanthus sonchifolius]|uniref:Uncharacterized protein n=1 Tax=Smallanthus sonchifolius TaxID=185202 RepID=A0ACB9BYD5_9ASTR|nr:hypothetical protein L1987_66826 [Smallanthus sonchifolius]
MIALSTMPPYTATTIVATTTILLLTTTSASPNPRPFNKIYAFGDSYTDTGNTASASGPNAFTYVSNLPYGSTFFHHPTNRYSDGRLAVFDDALIWVGEIGANDYAYTVGSLVQSKTIQQLSIRNVNGFLEALIDKGAKYMVVEGLMTTGRLTLSMSLASNSDRDDMGCVASLNKQSYDHNTILLTKIQDLRRKYLETVIIYANYWNAYRSVIKNAPKLGFKELYKVCCGSSGAPYNFDLLVTCGSQSSSSCQNPSQYINWDGVHLTEAMNKVVAESFLKGGFTHPPFGSLMSRKQYSRLA